MNIKEINNLIQTGDIRIHTINLDTGIYGFVYYSRKGRYHIFISNSLSPQGKNEVLLHEIYHVIKDMPKIPYIVGLNMQYEALEKANKGLKQFGTYYNKIVRCNHD